MISPHRRRSRLACCLLVLATTPSVAVAAPGADPFTEPTAEQPEVELPQPEAGLPVEPTVDAHAPTSPSASPEEVERLRNLGKTHLDSGKYGSAIAAWTELYKLTASSSPVVAGSALIDISRAYRHIYDKDRDPAYLRRARNALELLLGTDLATAPGMSSLVDTARTELQEIEALLAVAENVVAGPGRQPVGGFIWISDPSPPPTPEQIERNKELTRKGEIADGLIIAGSTLLTIGIPAALLAASWNYSTPPDERAGPAAVMGSGIVFSVSGTVLLTWGLIKRGRARNRN